MRRIAIVFIFLITLFVFSEESFTRITSEGRLVLDYQQKIANFYDNVFVKSENGVLRSDQLTVFFDSKFETIEKMIAKGNVLIDQQNHKAESKRAEYFSKTGKLVLTGDPIIQKGENYYSADVITIDTNTSKVYFEPSARIVIKQSE